MGSSRRPVVAMAAIALAVSACAGAPTEQEPSQAGSESDSGGGALNVAVASFDLHTGEDQRLTTGLFTDDQSLLVFGDVEMEARPLAVEDGEAQEVTGSFLPVPGSEPEGGGSAPTILEGGSGTGVYETRLDLDEPGLWELEVTAELEDGSTMEGSGQFQVAEEAQIVEPGEPAPETSGLTVDDIDGDEVLPVMVDSRAQDEGAEIPDQHLHQTTVAEALEQGRPVAVLVSTPVYCQSRFCGPITEVFADIAEQYADRAEFVHLEVWHDFDDSELNQAAAEWIQTESGGSEPWTFLVDADGTVIERWDNVLNAQELVDELEALPAGDEG